MPIPSDPIDLQIGVEAQARSNVRETLRQQLRSALQRGDAWPETILPGSEPILPIPSDPIDLQLGAMERDEELTVE